MLGSRAAVLRRSEPTRFTVGERRRSRRLRGAIRARDVRAGKPICRRNRRNESKTDVILR